MIHRRPARIGAPLAALLLLGACATMPGQDRLAERDPLEKFNRGVWGINRAADKVVIRPVTSVYRAVAPRPLRQGVSNFFANLTEPWSFVNNVLQGKIKRAGHNLKRFVVNTTIGIGGLFDPASRAGITPAREDLGQTLAHYGVNGGPYLVLPLLGPSTLRDGIGSGVAFFADPVSVAISQSQASGTAKLSYRIAQVVNARSELTESGGDAFLKSSLDPYAAARSAYLQRRRADILDQDDSVAADDDMSAAGPPDEPQPAAEAVPTPVGDAAATPPAPVTPDASAAETPAPADTPRS